MRVGEMTTLNDRIRRKVAGFRHIGIWPKEEILNVNGWLSNFSDADKDLALYLLDNFIYFNQEMVDKMFLSCFHNLSRIIIGNEHRNAAIDAWNNFLATVIITFPTGEDPNPTDSGLLFSRYARQQIGIPQNRIVYPQEAIEYLLNNPTTPLVFVDDFMGSGNQFVETWQRQYTVNGLPNNSFQQLALVGQYQIYYCPLIATKHGKDRLLRETKQVKLAPVYMFDQRHSVISDESYIWPTGLRDKAIARLREISYTQLHLNSGGGLHDWRGYRALGLALSFAHGTPDATMPIFHSESNGWVPLVRIR